MKLIIKIIALMIVSIFIYVGVFSIFKKPISLGTIDKRYGAKLAYKEKLGIRKKIVVIAGSNGFFSHSCEVIEVITGLGCVNTSMSAGLSLEFIFEKGKEFIAPGDIVLMPLEYNFYALNKEEVKRSPTSNNYLFQYDHVLLSGRSLGEISLSIFSFDFKYLFASVVENITGLFFKEHFTVMNKQGDITNHTKDRGVVYREKILRLAQAKPSAELTYPATQFYSQEVIADFLKWAVVSGVSVYGSLPTTFADEAIDQEALEVVKKIYLENKADFIELPGNSQYKRECFFDTEYHLHKSCQREHSIRIAKGLLALELARR